MSEEWVQEQLQFFRFSFDEADKDKNGKLSLVEIRDVLKAQGFNGGQEDVKAIFRHFDWNENKTIDREEFVEVMRSLPKMSLKEFALRNIFKKLDMDGNGFITEDEIRTIPLKDLSAMEITLETLDQLLFTVSCCDEDGKLSYEEFLEAYIIKSEGEVMRQLFTKLDADNSGFLTKEEIYEAFKSDFELKLSFDKIANLVMQLQNADGKINYEEFLKVWLKKSDQKC